MIKNKILKNKMINKYISFFLAIVLLLSSSGVSFAATDTDKNDYKNSTHRGEMKVTGDPKIKLIKEDGSEINKDNPAIKEEHSYGLKASFNLENIPEVIDRVSSGELPSIHDKLKPFISELKELAIINGSFELEIDLEEVLAEYFIINQEVLDVIKQNPNELFKNNEAYTDIFDITSVDLDGNKLIISVVVKNAGPHVDDKGNEIPIMGADILALREDFQYLDMVIDGLFDIKPDIWSKVDDVNKGVFENIIKVEAPDTVFIVRVPQGIVDFAGMLGLVLRNPFVGIKLDMNEGFGDLVLGYEVEFDSNGGSIIDRQLVLYAEEARVPANPTKDNMIFAGWYEDKELTKKYDFTTEVKEDMTLYAKWAEFKVTYDGNKNTDGTAPIDSIQLYVKDDEVTVLPKGDLSRTGYTFKGWNTSADGSGTSYKAGDTFKITEDTTLYAMWEKDSDSSGGGWTWGGTTSKTESKTTSTGTLTHTAYLNGYPDNTIRPQGSITRAEVAAIFARLKVGEANIPSAKANYNDVNSSDWYTKYIAFVTDNNIMKGYEDGSFRPNDKITRAEFTAVVARYNSLADTTSTFEDVIGHWAAGYIGSVTNKGWINGYPDGTFKPEKDISREEVATMVNKMLDRKVDKDGLNNLGIKNFKDLDNSSWSYFDIVEASNSHKSVRRTLGDIMENWKELIK